MFQHSFDVVMQTPLGQHDDDKWNELCKAGKIFRERL